MEHATLARMTIHPTTREACAALDARDPLAPFAARFTLPAHLIYLDGNSLGVLPKTTAARVAHVVQQEWGQQLIESWNTAGWMDLPQRVGGQIAQLIGAVCAAGLAAVLFPPGRRRPSRR